METFVWLFVFIIAWGSLGAFGARMELIAFESEFGHGQANDLVPLALLAGPISFVISLNPTGNYTTKELILVACGLRSAKHDDDLILHEERTALSRFLARGISGPPENKDYDLEKILAEYPHMARYL